MINRLYYKSDFKSEVTLPSTVVGRPFRFTYTTSGARSLELKRFVAYRDADGHCENCTVVPREVMQPDGSIITEERVVVNFDNHGLRPGTLRTERKYFLADDAFTLEGFNPAKLRELDLELTTHADDTLDLMLIEQEPKDEELLMILRGKDAYETAVASGYTGTREQWLQDGFGVDVMAVANRIATANVTNIYQAADLAKLRATTEINQVASEAQSAINETAETAKSDVSDAASSAKEEITSTATTAKEEVSAVATTAKEEVSAVATTAKEEVSAVATTAKTQIESEAATATSEITTSKQTAIAAVEQSASSATSSIEAAQHAIEATKQALDQNTEAILTARDNAQDAETNASSAASAAAVSATASAQSASDSAKSASDSAHSAEAAATSAKSASDSASSATSTLSTIQAEHSAIDETLAAVASQGESAAIAAVSAQVAQNKEGLNDLAQKVGDIEDLETPANNLVEAINNAASSGGGGLNEGAIGQLIKILKNCVYVTPNQVKDINDLEELLHSTPGKFVKKPIISIEDGICTISCATENAIVRYTLDGTIPTSTSTKYSAQFELSNKKPTTIKAVGILDDVLSAIAEKVYNPTIVIDSPSFNINNYVVIISAEEGMSINYTTDGSNPTAENGDLYTEPFSLSFDCVIKAIAYDQSGNTSNIASIGYEADKSRIIISFADPYVKQVLLDATDEFGAKAFDKNGDGEISVGEASRDLSTEKEYYF